MTSRHWPPHRVTLRTPRLELRVVDEALTDAIIDLAGTGIHDRDSMPFAVPFTDEPDEVRTLNSMRYFAGELAACEPARWSLHFAVAASDGTLLGQQSLTAADFCVRRTVETGSWLARVHQGRGIGTEMRHAVLALAFDGLGAQRAESGAWWDNAASLAVSDKVGYRHNGTTVGIRRGVAAEAIRLTLAADTWRSRPDRPPVEIEGLGELREFLGISEPDRP